MRAFRNLAILAVLLALPAAPLAAAGPAAPTSAPTQALTPKANARQLFKASERALGGALRAARDPAGAVHLEAFRQRRLRLAFEGMERALGEVGDAMAAKDAELLRALTRGSRALAELRVAWAGAGRPSPAVSERLEALATSYRLLRAGYGGESLRRDQGGPLSDAERRRFARLKEAERRLAGRLAPLRKRAAERGDAAFGAELDRVVARSEEIAAAAPTLDGFLDAVLLCEALEAEWLASAVAVAPDDRADWRAVGEVVEEMLEESQVGFVFAADLETGQSWGYLEEETEVPEEVALYFEDEGDATLTEISEAPPLLEGLRLGDGEADAPVEMELAEEVDGVAEETEEAEDVAAVEPEDEIQVEDLGDADPAEAVEPTAEAAAPLEGDEPAVAATTAPSAEGEMTEPAEDLNAPFEVTTESGEVVVVDLGGGAVAEDIEDVEDETEVPDTEPLAAEPGEETLIEEVEEPAEPAPSSDLEGSYFNHSNSS